ncbi:cuticle protein 16.8 [Trichonephila clavipes]|nr:cuticle protein 16.8 [Trichonephila clavipes]
MLLNNIDIYKATLERFQHTYKRKIDKNRKDFFSDFVLGPEKYKMFSQALRFLIVFFAVTSASHREHHHPQPYKFGYEIKDHHGSQHRHEHGDGHGHVQGSYGFTDHRGIHREVLYVADHNGFRATVKTNEAGTANQDPAHVKVQSNAHHSLSHNGINHKQHHHFNLQHHGHQQVQDHRQHLAHHQQHLGYSQRHGHQQVYHQQNHHGHNHQHHGYHNQYYHSNKEHGGHL